MTECTIFNEAGPVREDCIPDCPGADAMLRRAGNDFEHEVTGSILEVEPEWDGLSSAADVLSSAAVESETGEIDKENAPPLSPMMRPPSRLSFPPFKTLGLVVMDQVSRSVVRV